MDNLIDYNEKEIENLIYEIRGKQVMLDSDLARLYKCVNGTKTINLAVKRHINRFPERFMFQLSDEEYKNLRFQIETSNVGNDYGGRRYNPYVFTEQGVAMLATVLRTEVAEEISIKIMDAFVALRHYISDSLIEQNFINKQVLKNTEDIKKLQESFNKFEEKRKVNEIYFNGQIYDAYSKIQDIFKLANKKMIIIDAYADKNLLDIIRRLNVNFIIITNSNKYLTKQDIEKYNNQYHNLEVIFDNTFHDRYFIIDNKNVYHCGASINRIGYKTFSISLIGDNDVKELLINRVNNLINNEGNKDEEKAIL